MIIALFIILSIPVGYLFGGKLKNVKNYTTRALGLPIAAFLLEATAPFLRNLIPVPIAQWHWVLVTVQYSMLFVFCILNRKTKAVWVLFMACFLNFFVIAAFGFRMPVTPYAVDYPQMAEALARIQSGEYFRYTLAKVTDAFWYLGDVIVIPLRYIGGFASIGDILLGLGCGWLFFDWMRTEPQTEQSKTQPVEEKKA